MNNKVTCPICFGGESVMKNNCKLCKGSGEVTKKVYDDIEKELHEFEEKDDASKYFDILFQSFGLIKKNEKSYFELIQKSYSCKELIELFEDGKVLIPKIEKPRITFYKFNLMLIEDQMDIKLFKSFYSDKYVLLKGFEYVDLLLEYKDSGIKALNKEIKIEIIYSNQEHEEPYDFYKRIYDIYNVAFKFENKEIVLIEGIIGNLSNETINFNRNK